MRVISELRRPGPVAVPIGPLLVAWLAAAGPLAAQEVERRLTLEEAVVEAIDRNAELSIAEAERTLAEAEADGAGAFVWPEIGASTGVVRSNDPVFAFGTKLRQGVFGEPDFAVDALNDPDPISDWTAGLDVRWGALAPTRWAERAAAERRADAAGWAAARTREATRLRTSQLYFGALRAGSRLEAAEANEEAARATLERFARREDRGLLTRADRLQAEAELEGARAARIDAARLAHDARQALGSFLGWSADTIPVPADSLEAPTERSSGAFDPGRRADLRALASALAASEAGRRAAALAYAPSVDAFGNVRAHGDDPFGADGDDWTLGVALRWRVFAGFARDAALDRARAAERIARVRYEQARREAVREVDAADRAVVAAREGVEAAAAARLAAEDATRLMRRRFEEGLATPDDLLQAEARLASTRSRAVDALARWHLAVARAEFVRSQTASEEIP